MIGILSTVLLVAFAGPALAVSPSDCEIRGDVSLHWEGFEDGVSRFADLQNPQNNDYWRLEIDRIENTRDDYYYAQMRSLLVPVD